ncbi:MAG: LPXTG cell wall anchor domain-containing protein [Ilumatobacteraceae bacterium]
MNASPRSARRTTQNLSLPIRIASAGLAVAAATTALAPSASASEFYTDPKVSPISSCQDGVYHYDIGLYNLMANESTDFTVTVSGATKDNGVTQHNIVGGGQEWLNFTVPEGQLASFHVVNDDAIHPIDFLAEPRADCIADPETHLSIVCDVEGSGNANLLYEWVNYSYTPAHFGLSQGPAIILEADDAWIDHEQSHHVAVDEGEHVVASITVDGVATSSIDTIVDCLADPTIPATVPDTIGDSVPQTTIEVLVTTPSTTTPSTVTTVGPTSTVARLPRPEGTQLPVTGSRDATGSALLGVGLLAVGLGLVRLARRAR